MSPELRFAKYVNRTEDCWLWTGAGTAGGYGQFRFGHEVMAHRVAWVWAHGPIPDGMQIHHICRVRRCVNPAHLQVVTPRQNIQHRHHMGWKELDMQVGANGDQLTVTLSAEQSAWVRDRALASGLSPDEIVSRAIYRHMRILLRTAG